MKTYKFFIIFTIAAAGSLAISKQIKGQSDREDFKITRYASANNSARVVVEHSLLASMDSVGKIEGAFYPKDRLTDASTVYLRFKDPSVSVGDRFLIYSNLGGVRVPGSFFQYIGNNIVYKGSVQITSVLPTAIVGKISDASIDIEVGDLLTPHKDISFELKPKEPSLDVRGTVLGSPRARTHWGL